MNRYIPILITALVGLGACAPLNTPITATGTTATSTSSFQSGLADADYNLQGAIGIGALPKTDPLAACIHPLIPPAPVAGAAPPASFTPRTGNLEADASILYIRAQQAKAAAGVAVANLSNCDALIGAFVRTTVTAGVKTLLPIPIP